MKSSIVKKELSNAGWMIGARIIQMMFSFFISILTARYLGPDNYGLVNYGMAYVGFFTALCTLGINSIIVKELVSKPKEEGTIMGTTIFLRFFSSVLSVVLICVVVFFVDYGEQLTQKVVFLCSLSLIFQVFDTINYWFQSRYMAKVTSLSTLGAYVIVSIYKMYLLMTGKGVVWFAISTSIDYVCVAVLQILAYKKYNGAKMAFSCTMAKNLLGKSYHFILSGLMVAIYGYTDKFMLKQMLNETVVGYYSIATTISTMWVFILAAVIDSVYPTIMKLYETDYDGYKKKNKQLYAIVFYMSMFVSVLFMIFGKLIIDILYGDKYALAVTPLKIVTWYTAFSYLGVARNAWIVCENEQKYLKYMYFGAAIINIILNLLLIPQFGAAGAAFASLITQIFTSLILPALFKGMRPNTMLMLEAIFLRGVF